MSLNNKIIIGTNNNDTLNYSTSTKGLVIDSRDGNDNITTGSGNDLIFAGNGNDIVHAGAGNDLVDGGNGNDTLYGDSGNDLLYGGAGSNLLFGGSGNDLLLGGWQHDELTGGAGNDTVYGGWGSDLANYSGNRSDYSISAFWGGFKIVDNVAGRDGTDFVFDVEQFNFNGVVINANNLLNNTTSLFTNNSDTVNFNNIANLSIYTPTTIYNAMLGNDNVTLPDSNHVPVGYDNNNLFNAGAGNDIVNGGDMADKIDGGDGNDLLNGGLGDDTLYISLGNDTVNGGDGFDTADFTNVGTLTGTGMHIFLSSETYFNDAFTVQGTPLNLEAVIGTAFDDQIDCHFDGIPGSTGSTIDGGAGNDDITANSGIDTFRFHVTNDDMGDGIDTLSNLTSGQDHLAFGGVTGANDAAKLATLDSNVTVTDGGVGGNIVITFNGDGDTITLVGAGTATNVDSIADLDAVFDVSFF